RASRASGVALSWDQFSLQVVDDHFEDEREQDAEEQPFADRAWLAGPDERRDEGEREQERTERENAEDGATGGERRRDDHGAECARDERGLDGESACHRWLLRHALSDARRLRAVPCANVPMSCPNETNARGIAQTADRARLSRRTPRHARRPRSPRPAPLARRARPASRRALG